ncbi:tubulin delta chain-like isoform X2 [Limulus polyphemus]|uniref:Tubulin delta chain n=1 Tax=Limulus polyphemus TaxID=6850 RepID=A0ABM1BDX6_LIMPO|nr:tubulin delta chain-like isoform X2 [Limulus polyphemus]
MSVVVCQFGQCGNQLAFEFFNGIYYDINHKNSSSRIRSNFSYKSSHRFFRDANEGQLPVARAVMVDTEPKVIREVQRRSSKGGMWKYPDGATFMRREGAANNWAKGYLKHGEEATETILNLIRQEVESCDWLTGFVPIMSLAGGTGSGLGARVVVGIRDSYPRASIIPQVIWPYLDGEVTIQSYNCVLSLSHLVDASDLVVTFENDILHRICNRQMAIKNVSFNDINAVAARQMLCLMQPSETFEGTETNLDLLAHLAGHPQYKLCQLNSVPEEPVSSLPYCSTTWPALFRSLRRTVVFKHPTNEGTDQFTEECPRKVKFLSNLLILRGKEALAADKSLFQEPQVEYVSWIPPAAHLKVWYNQQPIQGRDKTALLCSNGMGCIPVLDATVSKAWTMFTAKAYLHHYNQYGFTNEDFVNSFIKVEQILASYRSLNC